MQTVVLVIHVMIALGLIGVVMIQRSEGGGLGIGGGQSNFMSGRGTANLLTRATAILAGLFMVTSVVLVVMEGHGAERGSVLQSTTGTLPVIPPPPPNPANVPQFPTNTPAFPNPVLPAPTPGGGAAAPAPFPAAPGGAAPAPAAPPVPLAP